MIRNILIGFMSLCFLASCQQKTKQPNIILIYVDDMGLGDATFTSGKVRPTPNIDKMASEGKVFSQYYTNAPICSPSRVAITTGMYTQRWNINTFLSEKKHNKICDQLDYLKSRAPSLAKSLKSAGYATAHIGKWHMGGGRDVKEAPSITEYGFDEYCSTWESPDPDPLLTSSNWIWDKNDSIKRWDRTSYFVDKTLGFLKRNKNKPCYINLWPDDVHSPWLASEQYYCGDFRTPEYYTLEFLKPVIDVFDKDMKRLMDGIKELGLDENTLIVFTSDNGPHPSFDYSRTNGMRGLKGSLYEGGINMPFFVRWPGHIMAGQTDSESVISAVDLFPTLCAIGGAVLPDNYVLDGKDISKSFFSEKEIVDDRKIFWEYGRRSSRFSIPDSLDNSPVLAVRFQNWKCFTSFDGETLELYNLKTDPREQNNIATENKELVNNLRDEMLEWFEKTDKSDIR